MIRYNNSLHEGYDGLNPLEQRFADALDNSGLRWCRNASRSGYGIPLITPGTTNSFYPDFLAWDHRDVFALDTTGGHLLPEKAARKLLGIQQPAVEGPRVVIRFVSEGRWSVSPHLAQEDVEGLTVWELSPNQERRAIHVADVHAAVVRALRPAW